MGCRGFRKGLIRLLTIFLQFSISYITFTTTTLQPHVSAINVGHLQVVHEAPYDKLYLHLSGGTVCGVGWVRDLVLCL